MNPMTAVRWMCLWALAMFIGAASPLERVAVAEEPTGCAPCTDFRPKVLIPILGAIPNGPEGSPTSQEPAPVHPTAQDGTGPSGYITAGATQRAEQLRQEGYDAEIAYFSSMEAFLTWAEGLSIGMPPDCRCPFTHVEFDAHGNSSGPLASFPSQPGNLHRPLWDRLGEALRRIMVGAGHIIFGWCNSSDPAGPEYYPGGVTAGKSGRPVYGSGGDIDYPYGEPPYPVGHPYSEPHPIGPTGSPEGWHRFPPVVPGRWIDEEEEGGPGHPDPNSPLVPNGTTEPPVPPERVQPGDLDNDGKGKLPRHPEDPKEPSVPLVDPEGQPLKHPETGLPLTDPQGQPLRGPRPDRDGRPREDPANPHTPLTQPKNGPGFDPHAGRPFGSTPPGGHSPTRPRPTPDAEPHAP